VGVVIVEDVVREVHVDVGGVLVDNGGDEQAGSVKVLQVGGYR
jgi:hypothetical protein